MYIYRHLQPLINQLKQQFPALLITGARQVGKSTLLQHIAPDYQYLTFDDPLLLTQANDDPRLFFLNHPNHVILDEVQYAPNLFPLLKLEIDRQKGSGLFLLSGSQAFELMQNVSESLAGRVAILQLKGLSLREIHQVEFYQPFLPNRDYITNREAKLTNYPNIWQRIHQGDMPRLYEREMNWDVYYTSYLATYIERDVRTLLNVNDLQAFTRFMVAVASRSGELVNFSNIAQEVGVSSETIKRWLGVLQASGIVYLLAPFHNNHLKRAIKTPKLYFMDTGLMAYLTKWLTADTIQHGAKSGQFFETLVVSEIIKSFTNQGITPPLYFYRDTNQKEIDIIIEHGQSLYPIEIKTTASPNKAMAKAFGVLDELAETGQTIEQGTIICQYPNKLYLTENLVSLPIDFI
ncbi:MULTISPECIES: ATP-binding protein [unclassified Moraxella]|uniref:ATP-binding protein n=1 Tax=unclassified Moraxella TaxID=2685852 RepID=UPI003AF719BD